MIRAPVGGGFVGARGGGGVTLWTMPRRPEKADALLETAPVAPAGGRDRRVYRVPQDPVRAESHGPDAESDACRRAVRSVDWDSFRFIDLFAGIGGLRLGFESVGGRCVFSTEWDADAQLSYEANFGHKPHGDITQVDPESIPDHDALLAGFPCQPFSIIGERKGFGDTRGTLFFNVEEILRVKKPAAVLLENVKQFKTHDGGRTYRTVVQSLTTLGYFTHTAVLNALHYGVAQRRERTFIVGFRADLPFAFPDPVKKAATLDTVLEDDSAVDKKLWASEAIQKKRLERVKEQEVEPFYPSIWHENKGGHIGVHPYSCALRANASYNYLLVNGKRRPSGRENLRLQGFPDSYKIAAPHSAIRKQAGNSVAVPVIRAIAESMMRSLRDQEVATRPAPVVAMRPSEQLTLR